MAESRHVEGPSQVALPADDKQAVSDICTKFNQQLIFDPDSLRTLD